MEQRISRAMGGLQPRAHKGGGARASAHSEWLCGVGTLAAACSSGQVKQQPEDPSQRGTAEGGLALL